jgi:hypothetical protein
MPVVPSHFPLSSLYDTPRLLTTRSHAANRRGCYDLTDMCFLCSDLSEHNVFVYDAYTKYSSYKKLCVFR